MNLAEAIITKNAEKNAFKSAVGFKKKEGWKELSWKKFSEIIFKTANALKDNGVGENDKVAIYADNSAEWLIFDLAALSIGAITVPIYSTNNTEQAEYIINDSQAKIILVGNQAQYDAAFEITQKESSLQTVIVTKKAVWVKKENTFYLEDFIAKTSPKLEIVKKEYDDLATIIYTSGTTGSPKGVMLTHGNFVKSFDAHLEYFKFKNFENELSLAFLPLTHVFERCWSLFCLYGGAKVYFLEDPKDIAATLEEVKPTMMCAVPRFFQKVLCRSFGESKRKFTIKEKNIRLGSGSGKTNVRIKRSRKISSFWVDVEKFYCRYIGFQ